MMCKNGGLRRFEGKVSIPRSLYLLVLPTVKVLVSRCTDTSIVMMCNAIKVVLYTYRWKGERGTERWRLTTRWGKHGDQNGEILTDCGFEVDLEV